MSEAKLPTPQSPYSKLSNLLYASYLPKIVNVAIQAGVFETLASKGMNTQELAAATDTNESVMDALCDLLAAIDLLERKNERYELTLLAQEYLLKSSMINQLQDIEMYSGSSGPFDNLLRALKEGGQQFNNKMWAGREAAIKMEQRARAGSIQNVVDFVKNLPDFGTCAKMCDLAGNSGYYSYALTEGNQNLVAHVYDLPEVVAIAEDLRKDERNKSVCFHAFDIKESDNFGSGYDLFFVSHFLYEAGLNGSLADFFKKVNQAMTIGGIFVSNHISSDADGSAMLTAKIVELMTRAMGYPTHHLPRETLEKALLEAGFDSFTVKAPNSDLAFPAMLLSAKKVRDL
jgi:hypothetical protein